MTKALEAGKKQQIHVQMNHVTRAWGLRKSFTSVVAVFAALAGFLVLSLIVKSGGGDVELVEGSSSSGLDEKPVAEGKCDWYAGKWTYDESYPLYTEEDCTFMSDQLACTKFGRKDLTYQKWRWQPHECDLPRFNATRLLERLRGRRLVFVGDSLNRGQWVSMVCLLGSVISPAHKSMEADGSLVAFKAKEYNASIEFYWAPLLVESNSDHPVNHRLPDRIVRAESIQKHATRWSDADILVFNSYLWWSSRSVMEVLWGSFNDSNAIHKKINMLRSYELALKTWSDWLEFHVDASKTRLFFMSLSPTHFWGDEWGSDRSKNCYNETMPITKYGHKGKDSDERLTRIVQSTIEGLRVRGVNVELLNITQLSEYRKDGHPSVYRKQWEPLKETQLSNPNSYADCIHWCLPGVPDVWNEILYAHIFAK